MGQAVLNRLSNLRRRYMAHHALRALRGVPLSGPSGARLGYLDRLEQSGDLTVIDGWALADRVTLSWPGGQITQVPHLTRTDVAQATGHKPEVGFHLSVEARTGPFTLTLERGGRTTSFRLADLLRRVGRRRRLGLELSFLRDVALAAPAIAGWLRTGDLQHRATVRRRLGLDHVPPAPPIDGALFRENAPSLDAEPDGIVVVLPVYDAFELLAEVLDRIERHTHLACRLIVIEDCSPDPRVRPWLADWAWSRRDWVEVVEPERNLGFIGSANLGLGLARRTAPDRPVILLNADALVPDGWDRRLVAPLSADPQHVASVTPMSNDAEILSVPVICQPSSLPPGAVDLIDAAARTLAAEPARAELPTGIGFCMALNPRFLARVPDFDTSFGRGYGEEVDWSQRVRALGGRHIAVGNLFVEHRGGQSFGSADKAALTRRNGALISSRYPDYDAEVQCFIAEDPLRAVRLHLGIASLAARADAAVPIYLAHAMGGGAEDHLRRSVAADGDAVILRVGGARRFGIEVVTPDGTVAGSTEDAAVVRSMLSPLDRRRVVYSCGVGDRNAAELPGLLIDLLDGAEDAELEILCHDYFVVSPSYTLLGRDAAYRGVPDPASADPAHVAIRPDGRRVELAEWRDLWGACLDRAARIVVFSQASRTIMAAAYPAIAGRLRLEPHDLLAASRHARPARTPPRRMGVLGNIGLQKGAEIVRTLGQELGSDLVLIGRIDPAYSLPRGCIEHGPYDRDRIADLAERYGIDAWVIPSIWPETFCFTVHEALATGLPVLAFDLGGQGDAVRAAANGHPVRHDPDADLAQALLDAFRAL